MQPLQPLWTFESVLEALGGPTAVGLLTGNSCSAVTNWRHQHQGRFPSKHYLLMKVELAKAGYWAPIRLWGFSTAASVARKSAA